MNIEEFREFCLTKPGVTESFPFDEDTLVFKVGGKMFALTSLASFESGIALKCDPEKALQLREQFPDDVTDAYHMNKKHWNSVKPNGTVPLIALKEWIDQSYYLVYNKLTKAEKLAIDIDKEPLPGLLSHNPDTN